MQSLNRHVVQERISLVVDTAVGSNADTKGLKGHLKALRKSVDEDDPGAGDSRAFAARMGQPLGVKRGR
jgi:hypothetical protein